MKKSIYWPTVFSFLGNEAVQSSVADCFNRTGIAMVPCDIPGEFKGTGNAGSIADALRSLDAENIGEGEDAIGLGNCAYILQKTNPELFPSAVQAVAAEAPVPAVVDPVVEASIVAEAPSVDSPSVAEAPSVVVDAPIVADAPVIEAPVVVADTSVVEAPAVSEVPAVAEAPIPEISLN